ncbi:OPA3-domain-containing protein [Vararia minispora EC-137]|uniref:OPA3-domain-containing protein n=1 Tax=Vararia minispora EC-137 TaxID=1314806 RepID=A0ACB8QUG1_9AGAM|nr:OPA3-domain-containing protein [Vararia minispora EC-137]
MASVKVGSLLIRTLAKPISNQIKEQVKKHETFRHGCVRLAQTVYKFEMRLRTGLLGEPAKHIRPLSEARAIDNGANFIAEGFLFSVAAGVIIAETWRSSRSEKKRREGVAEDIEELSGRIGMLEAQARDWAQRFEEAGARQEELTRVLERVVEIGLRGGWIELQDTPLRVPKLEMPGRRPEQPSSSLLPERPSDSDPDKRT